VSAQPLVLNQRALVFDPIRALDDQRERYAERGNTLRIAQQAGDVGGFAGAVDAALGIDKSIESIRRRPARDPAVGEIEGGRRQAEKGVIAFRIGCREQRWRGKLPRRWRAPTRTAPDRWRRSCGSPALHWRAR